MKNKQLRQHTSAKSAFKAIGPILCTVLQIEFSTRCNAMYGPVEFFGRLFEMCKNREYAETAHSSATGAEKKTPTSQWILGKMKTVRRDYMLKRCQKVTDRTVRQMRRRGMFRKPVDVAIDKHLVCRYDRFDRIVNTIKSKYKRGTCNFNCLATVNCIVEDSRAFLGAKLFLRGQSNSQTISELIEGCRRKGIAIRSLKMDREFFAVDIMNMLDEAGIAFTIPAIKTQGIKKAINEFKQGVRDVVSRHSITSADGNTADFTLIILDRGDGKFFTFATNASIGEVLAYNSGAMKGAEGFAEEYRSRWGVETAYKDYESARPRTTSRNESVRILLLFMPIFMYNAWCLAKHLAQASCHAARVTLKGLLKLFCRFILDPCQTAFPT